METKAQLDAQVVYSELKDIKNLLINLQARATPTLTRTGHPYIVRVEGVCGGRPVVAGTRLSVRTIVERTQLGESPEQIVLAYPPLTLAQVYAALSYYHEHKAEVDAEVQANEEALAWVLSRNRG